MALIFKKKERHSIQPEVMGKVRGSITIRAAWQPDDANPFTFS